MNESYGGDKEDEGEETGGEEQHCGAKLCSSSSELQVAEGGARSQVWLNPPVFHLDSNHIGTASSNFPFSKASLFSRTINKATIKVQNTTSR